MSFFDTEEAHAGMLGYPAWRVKLQIEAACPGATTWEYDPVLQVHGYTWP
jgi:hypothetical protein